MACTSCAGTEGTFKVEDIGFLDVAADFFFFFLAAARRRRSASSSSSEESLEDESEEESEELELLSSFADFFLGFDFEEDEDLPELGTQSFFSYLSVMNFFNLYESASASAWDGRPEKSLGSLASQYSLALLLPIFFMTSYHSCCHVSSSVERTLEM